MTFADDFQAATLAGLQTGLGEQVTYYVGGTTPQTIWARVARTMVEADGLSGALMDTIELHVLHHATDGVTSVDTELDRVSVARHFGGTAQLFAVRKVLFSNPMKWVLDLAT